MNYQSINLGIMNGMYIRFNGNQDGEDIEVFVRNTPSIAVPTLDDIALAGRLVRSTLGTAITNEKVTVIQRVYTRHCGLNKYLPAMVGYPAVHRRLQSRLGRQLCHAAHQALQSLSRRSLHMHNTKVSHPARIIHEPKL